MSRKARNLIKAKLIHVVTKGIKNEFIFYKEIYKNRYIKLINQYLEEMDSIELLAYCIMDNHAHLLLYIEQINQLTTFMKKLNTSYAMYYNVIEDRSGYVFVNRYYTQVIENEIHLIACINYIYNNPVKAGLVENKYEYKYSSCKFIKNKKWNVEILEEIIGKDLINNLDSFNEKDYKFIDTEQINKNIEKKTIEEMIQKFCNDYQTSISKIKKSNDLIIKLKKFLNKENKVSNKNICAILGIGKNRISIIEKNTNIK